MTGRGVRTVVLSLILCGVCVLAPPSSYGQQKVVQVVTLPLLWEESKTSLTLTYNGVQTPLTRTGRGNEWFGITADGIRWRYWNHGAAPLTAYPPDGKSGWILVDFNATTYTAAPTARSVTLVPSNCGGFQPFPTLLPSGQPWTVTVSD